MNEKEVCMYCNKEMQKSFMKLKGLKVETYKCSQCKRKILNEEQVTKAIEQLEERELKEKYVKHPVRIGNSWGIIFPNEVSKKFQLNEKKTELIIHPMLSKKMIELQIE
ncbi:MAG: hypothetical protein COT15_00045 [Candidatus Diapherotrites archaeon CG08_land_8_20_14_0_20_34_12]|nr:MAG: hypothetical protein COT15_00045 [Candidatus Diapherotrites archaeon CG08_land_8_20_14_0_20_34_12]